MRGTNGDAAYQPATSHGNLLTRSENRIIRKCGKFGPRNSFIPQQALQSRTRGAFISTSQPKHTRPLHTTESV